MSKATQRQTGDQVSHIYMYVYVVIDKLPTSLESQSPTSKATQRQTGHQVSDIYGNRTEAPWTNTSIVYDILL